MSDQAYQLPVWDTISTAWNKVYGAKASIWGALAVMFAIMFGLGILQGLFEDTPAIGFIISILSSLLGYLIQLGLIYMGIKRAQELPINFKLMFYAFDFEVASRLIGLYIMQILIFIVPVAIGALGFGLSTMGGASALLGILLIAVATLSGIFIAIRMSVSIGFALDQGVGPIIAIKKSFSATRNSMLNLLGLYILQSIIIGISAIPLGIGLIWTLPWSLVCLGVVYTRLAPQTQI
jgi:hypothetical protein